MSDSEVPIRGHVVGDEEKSDPGSQSPDNEAPDEWSHTWDPDDLPFDDLLSDDMLASESPPEELVDSDALGFRLVSTLQEMNAHSVTELQESVQFVRELLNRTPEGDPRLPARLKSLANFLSEKYSTTSVMADLDEAIDSARKALNIVADDDPGRDVHLVQLGIHLHKKYSATGVIADLEEAIQLTKKAVSIASKDENRAKFLSNLAKYLGDKYDEMGDIGDLEEAIDVSKKAVDLTDDSELYWGTLLHNLANKYGSRYSRLGAADDLNKAIDLTRQALKWVLEENRPGVLQSLSNHLMDRYNQTKANADIAESLQVALECVKLTPASHSMRPSTLHTLGYRLFRESVRSKDITYLEKAIGFYREALDMIQEHDPLRPKCLNSLGLALRESFTRTEAMSELEEAINVTRQAVDTQPKHLPIRAKLLNNLGDLLCDKFSRTRETANCEEAMIHYQCALLQDNSYPLDRIEAAMSIIRHSHDDRQAFEASSLAVSLIPRLIARSLENSDKQNVLRQLAGLASDAAATALQLKEAPLVQLNLLEQGRGVLGSSLEEMRTDILDLHERDPKLAQEFVLLRSQLEPPLATHEPIPGEDIEPDTQNQFTGRYNAGKKFDELVVKIRELPNMERFLLPPGEKEIITAASHGPIALINVTGWRCDAILVDQHRIWTLPLPDLSMESIDKKAEKANLGSPEILKWLWDTVAGPVLDALGFTQAPADDSWPRIWWIPTGPLSRFPLHAAGYHGERSAKTVPDRVMSSYSSSIKAIIYGRQHRIPVVTNPVKPRALLVAMEHTPGASRLPFARGEIAMLHGLCQSMHLDPFQPGRRKQDIMANLANCKIFHFAGHGSTNSLDPSKSFLLLDDWKDDPLTVASLLDLNLREHPPFLAYLSACGTGRIKDEMYFDESIHLISAFQLAGFRHVIGTLWEVNDEICVQMAEMTYAGMKEGSMTDESVCRGLHRATRELRDRWLEDAAKDEDRDQPARKVRIITAKSRTGATNSKPVVHRVTQFPRDIVPCDDDDDDEDGGKEVLNWVAYVHFGV